MLLASSSSSNTPIFILPNGTIIVELILFLIVLGIVAKFILPPLQRAMDERDATVRAALEASDEGREEAERLVAERLAVLEAARAEARRRLETAAQEAESLRADARSRGQVEHDRRLAEAQSGVDAEAARAREELAGRLETIVIAAAERVVGVQVDPARHRAMLDETGAALRRVGAGARGGA